MGYLGINFIMYVPTYLRSIYFQQNLISERMRLLITGTCEVGKTVPTGT